MCHARSSRVTLVSSTKYLHLPGDRPQSLNKLAVDMRMDIGCHLQTLVSHGRDFLSREEYDVCLRPTFSGILQFLSCKPTKRPA